MDTYKSFKSLILTALLVFAPAAVIAETPAETEILGKIHAANQLEILAGELAMDKGTTPEVRRYGELLMRDHQFADDRIMEIARRENVQLVEPVPATAEEQHQEETLKQMVEDLRRAEGPDFDRKFIEFNQMAHRMALDVAHTGYEQLHPSPTRTFVGRIAPILQQHQAIADALAHGEAAVTQGGLE